MGKMPQKHKLKAPGPEKPPVHEIHYPKVCISAVPDNFRFIK